MSRYYSGVEDILSITIPWIVMNGLFVMSSLFRGILGQHHYGFTLLASANELALDRAVWIIVFLVVNTSIELIE